MADPNPTPRKTLSVRTRFEVFKRDDFTCQYCGRRSPEAVLQVDHISPSAGGGSDDPINLITACWECNSGKAAIPLNEVMTGEDPHDRAIEILERQRQLDEYNRIIAERAERLDSDVWDLWRFWQTERGFTQAHELDNILRSDYGFLRNALEYCPKEQIREFMIFARTRGSTKGLRYVMVCIRNWRYEHQANKDMGRGDL